MNIFWGKVRKYNQRGRTLGFPTANVNLTKDIDEGVYISKTKTGLKSFPSLTFIGKSETFNDTKFHSETYILDFNKNIYNKWISVILLKKIRGNKKFNSASELIVEMKKDEAVAREYFNL